MLWETTFSSFLMITTRTGLVKSSPEMCQRYKMSVIRLNVDILMYFFFANIFSFIDLRTPANLTPLEAGF